MDRKSLLLDLGAKIKHTRRVAGMTQEALASALDVNTVTVSRWETGKQSLDYITLWRISDALGVSFFTLLLDDEKARVEDRLLYPYDVRYRKSNIATQFERIVSDLAHINPDIIVLIHKIAEAWDGIDDTKRQILSEGLSFVLRNFWSSHSSRVK